MKNLRGDFPQNVLTVLATAIKEKQEVYSTMPAKSYREDLLKRLSDSNYASQYLKVAFDETLQYGNMEVFLLALKNIVDAKCSVQEVVNEAQNEGDFLCMHTLLV